MIGFLAQFFIGVKWGIVPPTVGGNTSFTNLLLPALVLGSVSFAYVLRLTRTSVAENLTADYVRTATAKGLSRGRVVRVHVLRNSLIPRGHVPGCRPRNVDGRRHRHRGIFNINGVGGTIYQAVTRGEAPTVVSFVTILIVIYLIANLLVDLLYAALDPRIRYV